MNWNRFKVVWMLARRDIMDDRKVSLVVVAALSFSFLNLAFFPAFISGFSASFVDNIVETQTGHVQITADEGRIGNAETVVATVENLPGVVSVEKQLQFDARISSGSEAISSPVIGVESENLEVYRSRMNQGRFIQPGEDGDLVLGLFRKESATIGDRGLKTDVGERVTVSSGEKSRNFNVVGVVGRPGPGGANANVYIGYEEAEEFLDARGEASTVKVLLENRDKAESFVDRLENLNMKGDIRTWQEVSEVGSTINATFGIVTTVVSLVGVIVAVASIGVVIFINVNKRRREIGILRSIGTPRAMVLGVFVVEALIFGALGVLLGNGIMIGVHEYLQANPIQTPLGPLSTRLNDQLLLTRSAWLMASALIAGVLPSWFASRQEIVEAIENR